MLCKKRLTLVVSTVLYLGGTLPALADNGIVVEQVPLTGSGNPAPDTVQTQAIPKPAKLESSPLDTGSTTDNSSAASSGNGSGGSSNPSWDLYQQVQQLQQQVQQQEGTIEELNHTIDRMRNDQKAQYTDLDQRINTLNDKVTQLQQAPAPAAGSATPAPTDSSAGTPVSNIEEEKKAYLSAYEVFRTQGPNQAIPPMLTFVSRYPNSTFAPNAYYWLGEFYLAATPVDLTSSQRNFETVLKQYPNNAKAPAALYKLGIIADQQGKTDLAQKRMQDVLTRFPNSPEAALAKNYLTPPAPQPAPKTKKKKPVNNDN